MSNTHATPQPLVSRRRALIACLALGGVGAAYWFNVTGSVQPADLTVQSAFLGASKGGFTLIDIRRPDEWARTGVPVGAIPLDMRDPEFVQKLLTQVSGPTAPIALICARGVRSRHLAGRLTEAGFTNIIDVPEGMLGSGAGPGWLGAGLPVTKL